MATYSTIDDGQLIQALARGGRLGGWAAVASDTPKGAPRTTERHRHAEPADRVDLGQRGRQLVAVPLGHAAGDDELGAGPLGVGQRQRDVDRLLARRFDERAGVHDDEVGIVGAGGRLETVGEQRRDDLVGVDRVLRTPQRLDPEGLCTHRGTGYRRAGNGQADAPSLGAMEPAVETVRAERLVAGGAALSRRDDGRIVLVDDALPGELVGHHVLVDGGALAHLLGEDENEVARVHPVGDLDQFAQQLGSHGRYLPSPCRAEVFVDSLCGAGYRIPSVRRPGYLRRRRGDSSVPSETFPRPERLRHSNPNAAWAAAPARTRPTAPKATLRGRR